MISQRRQWHPTPVLLPRKSHGRRSLVGCSPWGCWESDTTERFHFHSSLSCIGEGNDNPLQCSCLENPRDGGAWWAAVYGVTQSQTRLKRHRSTAEVAEWSQTCSLKKKNWKYYLKGSVNQEFNMAFLGLLIRIVLMVHKADIGWIIFLS